MARVMRTYHERWRYRHPSSHDFYAVASDVAGRDLAWFFEQTTEGSGVLDYEIASLTTRPEQAPTGRIDGGTKAHLVEAPAAGRANGSQDQSRVIVRRLGTVVMPIDILLRYDGRPPERVLWDGRDAWKNITRRGSPRLVSAEIDPDRRLTLDLSRLNNAKRADPSARVAATWTARWMFWVQNLLVGAGL